jgi:serine/threonine protein kinase
MALDQAFPLLREMAKALSAAHRAGVVHRDFKSGNVMLVPTHDGFRAVVTDFGLARTGELVPPVAPEQDPARAPAQDEPEILGTPAYMAPEQLRGDSAGPATDVYAFGVVICEMLLGRGLRQATRTRVIPLVPRETEHRPGAIPPRWIRAGRPSRSSA